MGRKCWTEEEKAARRKAFDHEIRLRDSIKRQVSKEFDEAESRRQINSILHRNMIERWLSEQIPQAITVRIEEAHQGNMTAFRIVMTLGSNKQLARDVYVSNAGSLASRLMSLGMLIEETAQQAKEAIARKGRKET